MFKNILIAAALLIVSPSLVLAQDIFWSYSPMALRTSSSGDANGSLSIYIFSDGLLGFNNIDLDFSTTNSDLIRFTGGDAFAPGRYSPGALLTVDPETNSGSFVVNNVFGRSLMNPLLDQQRDSLFIDQVGPNGAFLLARVDFDIFGDGTADFELSLGELGIDSDTFGTPLNTPPTFGSATLDTSLPINDFIGDVNMDGDTNFFDIPAFIDVLVSGEYQPEADINFDGEVNFGDIPAFVIVLTNQ